MASHRRLSGMQKQILGLYRGFLRAARLKAPEERHRIESIVSAEFRNNAKNIDRKNTLHIEYLMRRGKKQLEQLNSPDIVGLSTLELTLSTTTDKPSPADRNMNPSIVESQSDKSVKNHGDTIQAPSL